MYDNDLDSLDFHIGSQLHAQGGILDHLDYRRLRRVGVQLRDIPTPHPLEDWDIPPSSLQGWVQSYAATIESVQIAQTSGLLALLKEWSDEIRQALSVETLSALDAQIIEQKTLEELIEHAKAKDRFKDIDFARLAPSVRLGSPLWAPSRPRLRRRAVLHGDRFSLSNHDQRWAAA